MAILAIGLSLVLQAKQAAADWSGKGEVGIAVASGNTETEAANAKIEVVNQLERWKHLLGLTGNYASDEVGTTGQRWEARGQSDFSFGPRAFWFGSGRYENDRFSGFEHQATIGTGLGYKFIDTEATKLAGQIGAGYKFFETRDSLADDGITIIPGDNDSELIFTGGIDFEHRLTETTQILNKFLVESGGDNTFLQNELALQVRMTEVLALAVGYAVRHNTDPPEGFEETDTLMTVNLVYEIR
jgi:putative salt-induced outer membrane protein